MLRQLENSDFFEKNYAPEADLRNHLVTIKNLSHNIDLLVKIKGQFIDAYTRYERLQEQLKKQELKKLELSNRDEEDSEEDQHSEREEQRPDQPKEIKLSITRSQSQFQIEEGLENSGEFIGRNALQKARRPTDAHVLLSNGGMQLTVPAIFQNQTLGVHPQTQMEASLKRLISNRSAEVTEMKEDLQSVSLVCSQSQEFVRDNNSPELGDANEFLDAYERKESLYDNQEHQE